MKERGYVHGMECGIFLTFNVHFGSYWPVNRSISLL